MYNICTRIKWIIIKTANMSTNELTKPEKIKRKIQLVNGEITPSDASNVIISLIDEKIKFHQKQKIQKWEQNHKNNSEELNDRIKQLENEKQVAHEFIANAKILKNNISINGTIKITIVNNQ